MLSVKGIKQGQNNNYYFEKDNNYYFKEDQEHLINAFEWDGKGAKALGLEGQVTFEDFKRVMDGILPDGQQLGRMEKGEMQHRPGFDLTFSAPKSVAILALVGGDDRLIKLHEKAVSVALSVIERKAQVRGKVNGEMTYESTQNLVIAKFIHDTSREGDPLLHTHAVVGNMTQKSDGSWRSLASDLSGKNGFFEQVMKDHTYYGMIYRAELAKGLIELGFELVMVNKHGMFEISGVPKEVNELFSKRRQQIEKEVERKGDASLKGHDKATLSTRKSKTQTSREALIAHWQEELKDKNWDLHDFLNKVAEGIKKEPHEPLLSTSELAHEIINDTMAILSQRGFSMAYNDIMRRATEYGIGFCTHADLVDAFEIGAKEQRFIPFDKETSRWTTATLIKTEFSLMNAVKESKEGRASFRVDEAILAKRNLSEQHKTLVKDLLNCQDRLMVLKHQSGDKHAFLTNLLHTIEDQGKTVKVLSPNAVHAHEVNENVERNPLSLWQWLKNMGKDSVGDTVAGFNFKLEKDLNLPIFVTSLKKGVVIVDAAQKISPEAMNKLFEITGKLQTKVVLLHDEADQQYAFQGDVMSTLQKAGIRTFSHDEEHKHAPKLHMTLHTIADDDVRLKTLALDYAQLPESDRQKTLVVGQSLKDTRFLNQEIREQLKNSNQLGRMEQFITTYQSVFLSKVERKYAQHYEKDMVLRQYNNKKMEEFKVRAVMPEENALWVTNEAGKKLRFFCSRIHEDTQIFQEKKLAVSEKETLVITGNMKQLDLKKGEKFTVTSVSSHAIILEREGKTVKLNPQEWDKGHFDHGYAESLSQLRMGKIEKLMTSMKSRAMDKECMHVLAKKSDNLTIYTNDSEKAERRFTAIPERTTIIDKVIEGYHDSKFIKKDITLENVEQIKKELNVALAHFKQELLKNPVEKAVDYAIATLSERNAGFKHEELVETAIIHALGKTTLEEVESSIRVQMKEGVLLRGKDSQGHTLWTTKEAEWYENEILSSVERGKNTQKSLTEAQKLGTALEQTHLNKGQRDACYLIGTTKDRFVMVQGYAGTGKSTTLFKLAELLHEKSIALYEKPLDIIACAPTHQAVKELQNLGIPAQTLKSLLVDQAKDPTDFSNKLILMDEDSMVSNKDFYEFATMVERNNGRAVYVGDRKQFLPVESGKPKEIILKAGVISVAYMTENVRQKNADVKEAVQEIIAGNIQQAFKKIDGLSPHDVPRQENKASAEWMRDLRHIESSIVEVNTRQEEVESIHKMPLFEDVAKAMKTFSEKTESVQSVEMAHSLKQKLENNELNEKKEYRFESSNGVKFNLAKGTSGITEGMIELEVEHSDGLKQVPATLADTVAAEYLSRPMKVRNETAIIIQRHEDRKEVHNSLFQGLINLGEIDSQGIVTPRLVNKGLTRVEARHIGSYKGGEFLKVNQEDYLKVEKIDLKTKSLECIKSDGSKEVLYPERISNKTPMEVFNKEEAFLSKGMRVKFTRTDKERNILANREWLVNEATTTKVQLLEKEGDRILDLNPTDLKDCHWDHAYTMTGYGAQGSTYKYVIDLSLSYLKNLTNQRAFYITVSRAKTHLMIFTDNKAALLSKFKENTGDKYAALEVLDSEKIRIKVPEKAHQDKKYSESFHASKEEVIKSGVKNQSVYSNENSEKITMPKGKEAGNNDFYGDKTNDLLNKISSKTENFQQFSTPKKPYFDAKLVEQSLKNKVEYVAQSVLGECNKKLSSIRELRYGNNGSLSVKISGEKQGMWHDFESDTGGGMIALISEKLNMNFKEALEYGASLVSATPEKMEQAVWKSTPKNDKQQSFSTQDKALKLVKESMPIQGTIAEKYLKNTRGVSVGDTSNLRFLPSVYTGKENAEKQKYSPAMLSVAKDSTGKVQSVQVTYLDKNTGNKADFDIKKRTYGSPQGASVLLQKGDKNTKSYITEGVETGLSVATAKPESHVIATIGKGNFRQLDPKGLNENVVFCLDNDANETLKPTNLVFILSAMDRLREAGKNVSVVIPEIAKNDLNDVLKKGGKEAVNETLNREISAEKIHEMSNKLLLEMKNKPESNAIKQIDLLFNSEGKLVIQSAISADKTADKILREQANFIEKMDKIIANPIAQKVAKMQEIEREI